MLYQKIDGVKEFSGKPAIPAHITDNIKYPLFEWQQNALENLLIFEQEEQKEAVHLLFNMATGTGKTLLMAACILHYYAKGYRHFLFFVNQNNIVDKTENNFIATKHSKYLFTQKMVIDNKTVAIKKVESFSDNPQGIEIKFTTVQKFYNEIHLARENVNTLDELRKFDLVMLADEAHHLNANTKKEKLLLTGVELGNNKNQIEKNGWEHTVLEYVLKPNANNVLLEFTATVPDNAEVQKKYENKTIATFDLKDFLRAGYTKKINLIALEADKKERILTALLFAWYRHYMAVKHKIPHFKPVILFRSKTIAESSEDYEAFLTLTQSLTADDFAFFSNIKHVLVNDDKDEKEIFRIFVRKIDRLLNEKVVNFTEIADWIKANFGERQTIITNSKNNTTSNEKTDADTEKLLNSLEDKDNPVRAIFTVKRLTEGWDVLNLFDIVRLYEGQNAGGSNKKTPQATVEEMQLIGRGVRYYPFASGDKIVNKRKFDDDLNNDLRVLEELCFHTFDDDKARYISHLRQELIKAEYLDSEQKIPVHFELKPAFKEKAEKMHIFINHKVNNPARQKTDLAQIKEQFFYEYRFPRLSISTSAIDFEDNQQFSSQSKSSSKPTITVAEIAKNYKHLFDKAMAVLSKRDNARFQFKHLQQDLRITSVQDLLKSEFLGDIKLSLFFEQENFDKIPNQHKLAMLIDFLSKIFSELDRFIVPYQGSEFEPKPLLSVFEQGKTKLIAPNEQLTRDEPWYALDKFAGNQLEKQLFDFIKEQIASLKEHYDDVYLLRNEEVYKIYDFEQGRGFAPDFLLLLKSKEKPLYYHIFIESKGEHLVEVDRWKEAFLHHISQGYGNTPILHVEHKDYRLIGLPFFTDNKKDFTHSFDSLYAKQ